MMKLLKLQVINHPVLGDQTINFIDPNEEKSQKYLSLIIGQNGTGKTQIIKAVISALVAANEMANNGNNKWNENYDIIFEIMKDNEIVILNSLDKKLISNTIFETKASKKLLPPRLLVSAYTFNDKFPKNERSEFYRYGGLKTTTNNIFLNRPSQDTFINLSKVIFNKKVRTYLNELFDELNFERKIKVSYRKKGNYKLLENIAFRKLINRVEREENIKLTDSDYFEFKELLIPAGSNKTQRRFQDDSILRTVNDRDKLLMVIKFIIDCKQNYKQLTLDVDSNNKGSYKKIDIPLEYSYSWTGDENEKAENEGFKDHVEVYTALSDLDIISFNRFFVYRKSFFDFDDASSGEFHLLHLLAFLLANIENNSIVLIDEPEISLHFNWQNKFFKLLEPITNNFTDSHFIIATHSHFLVSNLHKHSSSIISMKRDEKTNDLEIKNLTQIDTEGWSAEQILFDVFNVASDRNYYMSLLVDKLVAEMSKPKPRMKIVNDAKEKLSKFDLKHLDNKDPFKKIVKSLLKQ